MDKIINIVIIEDSIKVCESFKNCISQRSDIKLIGITSSDIEGLDLIRRLKPDAVILDIELNNGTGHANSFGLLEQLNKLKISPRPKIIVNTVVTSNTVYDYLHANGVDLIFYKNQKNYSINYVLDNIVMLSKYSEDTSFTGNVTINDSQETVDKISSLIENELNLIGISSHLQGRKYLFDAILFVISEPEMCEKITIIQYLVSKYKRSSSTISRAMQNAILHAWRINSPDDLELQYPYRINYETGLPTTNEFIFNYVDKIKKML